MFQFEQSFIIEGPFSSSAKYTHLCTTLILSRLPAGDLGDAPAFTFHGAGKRADVGKGLPGKKPTYLKTPGPGAYADSSTFGSQANARKLSMPRTKIGTSGRLNENKQYISTAHERALFGLHSPSPNLYNTTTAMGNQVVRL